MKKLFSQFISLVCIVAAIFGVVKWKSDWLDTPPAKKKNEAYYRDKIAKRLKGETEYKVKSGYVDIVTDKYAIEVEWARKWKEAIGQSLWYALQTGKKPKIILLMRKNDLDQKYLIMLNSTLQENGINIAVKGEKMEE